ncbi:hypothetical protein [Piscinibacter sp.]|jgi:hypothetical protein|uniref:hypothetical protein n=1 Tax=Piscinibacter sp. TaxID=1903157 RepID=UPI00355A6C52
MKHMAHKLIGQTALAATIGLMAPAVLAEAGEHEQSNRHTFSFALWGDMPYITPGITDTQTPKIAPLVADINAAKVAFTVFDGDIKSGSSLCTNDVYATAANTFNSFKAPMVYVLGDNEWTDCHRTNNGGYNNLERLTYIRQTMFASPYSFGHRPFVLEHQGPLAGLYVENTRWKYGDVVFVGLNVPGSNNNLVKPGECLSAKSVRTQVDCDADTAEYVARDAANIQFLKDTFQKARAERSVGVMVIIQADPGFDLPETETLNERALPGYEGYTAFLNTLASETAAFAGQVVLVHGDTHFFKIDKPLFDQAHLLPNFTRVETFGSPNVHWVKVSVDPHSRNVFTFEPMIVPGN